MIDHDTATILTDTERHYNLVSCLLDGLEMHIGLKLPALTRVQCIEQFRLKIEPWGYLTEDTMRQMEPMDLISRMVSNMCNGEPSGIPDAINMLAMYFHLGYHRSLRQAGKATVAKVANQLFGQQKSPEEAAAKTHSDYAVAMSLARPRLKEIIDNFQRTGRVLFGGNPDITQPASAPISTGGVFKNLLQEFQYDPAGVVFSFDTADDAEEAMASLRAAVRAKLIPDNLAALAYASLPFLLARGEAKQQEAKEAPERIDRSQYVLNQSEQYQHLLTERERINSEIDEVVAACAERMSPDEFQAQFQCVPPAIDPASYELGRSDFEQGLIEGKNLPLDESKAGKVYISYRAGYAAAKAEAEVLSSKATPEPSTEPSAEQTLSEKTRDENTRDGISS